RGLRELYLRTARGLLLFGIVVFLPLASVAPMIFPRIFGADWHRAGLYVQLTSLMFLAQFVIAPLSQTLNVIGRQDLQLAWDVLRLVTSVLLFLLAHMLGWSDVLTLVTFALAMTAMY